MNTAVKGERAVKKILACAAFGLLLSLPAAAGAEDGLTSLRGETAINQPDATPDVYQVHEKARLDRAYRQQPPLIPHRVEKYEIDLKVNQCLRCHDWPNAAREGAPKISETHYRTREGEPLDEVARTRWFCNQCHVPQTDARPLVENDFEPSRR